MFFDICQLKANDVFLFVVYVFVGLFIFWGLFEWWRDYKQMEYKEFFKYLRGGRYFQTNSKSFPGRGKMQYNESEMIYVDREVEQPKEDEIFWTAKPHSRKKSFSSKLKAIFLANSNKKLLRRRRKAAIARMKVPYSVKIKEFKEKLLELSLIYQNKKREKFNKEEEIISEQPEVSKVKIEGTFSEKKTKIKPASLLFDSSIKGKIKKEKVSKEKERTSREKNKSLFEKLRSFNIVIFKKKNNQRKPS